ncbi:hypothetical protein [Cryobacterium sp. Y82]|uniref:hypothetical protein n=1 Tax=Cryobacterium sp. Y82 TaxID=2045017 RepID=UPI000CE49E06|nr:hypothetical protein [Cryobacterium sp. Y82]
MKTNSRKLTAAVMNQTAAGTSSNSEWSDANPSVRVATQAVPAAAPGHARRDQDAGRWGHPSDQTGHCKKLNSDKQDAPRAKRIG